MLKHYHTIVFLKQDKFRI